MWAGFVRLIHTLREGIMTKSSLREGIAAYADQQKHLLSLLSDWVDQDTFDRHARSIGGVNMYGGKPRVLVPGSFMLGTLQSSGPAAEWLHLMQIMMQLGLIEAKKEQGKVWYRAVPQRH
jgi:hypothetical protein